MPHAKLSTGTCFVLILLFSFVLRLITLGSYETWNDEKISVCEANGSINFNIKENQTYTHSQLKKQNTLQNVIRSNIKADGGNGVLYAVTLHYWSCIFGTGDIAVRLLSVLLGVLVTVLIYSLTLQLFDNKNLALVAMLAASVHPQLISLSQETRTYMMAALFTLWSTYILLIMIKQDKFKAWFLVLYTVTVSASFLSHYSTQYIFLAHFFILIFYKKVSFKNWLLYSLSAVLGIAIIFIWMINYGFEGLQIILAHNREYQILSLIGPENPFYMKTSAHSLIAGWLQNLLAFSGNGGVNFGFRISQIAVMILIPFSIIYISLKYLKALNKKAFVFLLILTVSSLLYATILSLIAGHIISFQSMYAVFSTPYFVILIGTSIYFIFKTTLLEINVMFKSLAVVQLIIMCVTVSTIYLGLDTPVKHRNQYELLACKIEALQKQKGKHDFVIQYYHKNIALEVNRYFTDDVNTMKQVLKQAKENVSVSIYFPEADKEVVLLGKINLPFNY